MVKQFRTVWNCFGVHSCNFINMDEVGVRKFADFLELICTDRTCYHSPKQLRVVLVLTSQRIPVELEVNMIKAGRIFSCLGLAYLGGLTLQTRLSYGDDTFEFVDGSAKAEPHSIINVGE